jgi:YD repeat-containing protein
MLMQFKTTLLCLLLLLPLASHATTSKGSAPQQNASKTYDAKGKLIQKTTSSGRHYDAKGKYIGKTTQQGRHYDATGRYTGKTVTDANGSRLYNAQGKHVATVKQKAKPKPKPKQK